jgi:hypothetical protein
LITMMDGKPPKPPRLRDCWPLLPPTVAVAVLGVFDAALDRRPPFDTIERSPLT